MEYECFVDSTIEVYLNKLNHLFEGKPGDEGLMDLHTWLLYFSFDVIGDLTYGARHGFIESSSDVAGIIHYVKSFLNYGFIVSSPKLVVVFRVFNSNFRWGKCRLSTGS